MEWIFGGNHVEASQFLPEFINMSIFWRERWCKVRQKVSEEWACICLNAREYGRHWRSWKCVACDHHHHIIMHIQFKLCWILYAVQLFDVFRTHKIQVLKMQSESQSRASPQLSVQEWRKEEEERTFGIFGALFFYDLNLKFFPSLGVIEWHIHMQSDFEASVHSWTGMKGRRKKHGSWSWWWWGSQTTERQPLPPLLLMEDIFGEVRNSFISRTFISATGRGGGRWQQGRAGDKKRRRRADHMKYDIKIPKCYLKTMHVILRHAWSRGWWWYDGILSRTEQKCIRKAGI